MWKGAYNIILANITTIEQIVHSHSATAYRKMSQSNRNGENPWATNQPASEPNKGKQKQQRGTSGALPKKPSAATKKQSDTDRSSTFKPNPKAFEIAQRKHLDAAKRVTAGYESSSDEEELATDELLASVLTGYGGDPSALNRTQQCLETMFQSGAATCLICIATIRRVDHVWQKKKKGNL